MKPKNMKLSPMAVIPQKGRRGRIILDFYFPVYQSGVKRGANPIKARVNEKTERLKQDAPVKEIGNVFRRILHFIDSLAEGDVLILAKIDLLYGFWWMIVEEEAKWKFSYVILDPPGTPPCLVVTSALQIGWLVIPAYFCATTETGQDLTNQTAEQKVLLPVHSPEGCIRLTNIPKRSLYERPQ